MPLPMRAQPDARTARTNDATAAPISSALSSWMKWTPGTLTSVWLGQVRTKSQGATADERTGLAFDEQFGDIALRQPRAVFLDGGDDVGGLALDRDVARPRQRRPAILAGVAERFAVVVHLLVGELALDRTRAAPARRRRSAPTPLTRPRGAEALEDVAHGTGEVRPIDRHRDRLHVRDARHPVAVLVGPVEPERRTPVVQNEYHPIAEVEFVPQCEQVLTLFGVVVTIGSGVVELVGAAHADQVARDESAQSPRDAA